MARLETQINQIYLTHPEGKKHSLILYEEQLTPSLQLFVVAELWNMQKKSESQDLKKISEIILQSFRGNKKLPAETLFETSLSQINQNLADLAHEGHKSWVGKFSCMICIKSADNRIYLANNGQTSAWLKRKSEVVEILPSEKRGTHPLKTFINFTAGKLTANDTLILTTANIFNYIAFELFTKILDQLPLPQASEEITKILQSSMTPDLAFCAFLMHFTKQLVGADTIETSPAAGIYAPLPEEILEETPSPKRQFKLPALPKFNFKFPAFNWEWVQKFKLPYFQRLSRAGKFFFLSFAIFLLLFLINLAVYAGKLHGKRTQSQTEELVSKLNTDIAQTQSALIYKDETEALKQLNLTLADLDALYKINPAKADELSPKVEQVKTSINKINTVSDPKTFIELKHHPLYLSHSSIGFLFGNQDSNSLSLYDNKQLKDYFFLNSLHEPITSLTYFSPAKVVVSTADQIYRIDETLKQLEPLTVMSGVDIMGVKVANNALYALSKTGQILKITFTKNKYQTATVINDDFSKARDFGVDKDIYVLYADKLIKYVGTAPQAFPLPNMTDQLTNGNKLVVGANLYILESNKKRIIVMSKLGALINQIYFPTTSSPSDFYVDESARIIYLLDDNNLYKITF